MKVSNRQILVVPFPVIKYSAQWGGLKYSFLLLALILFLVPCTAIASNKRYVIDFDDSHIRGPRGEVTAIFLKKSLKEQYPRLDLENSKISRVVLVAKSKKGKGTARLRVGSWMTGMHRIKGSSRSFKASSRSSFDRVSFNHPYGSSRGPWQVHLKGNLVVRKVIVEIEDHSWQQHHNRWRSYKR